MQDVEREEASTSADEDKRSYLGHSWNKETKNKPVAHRELHYLTIVYARCFKKKYCTSFGSKLL